jgi:hypothetical protein
MCPLKDSKISRKIQTHFSEKYCVGINRRDAVDSDLERSYPGSVLVAVRLGLVLSASFSRVTLL